MKLDLTTKVMDYSGEPLKEMDGKEFDFSGLVKTCVTSQAENKHMSPSEKLMAFQIGLRVFDKSADGKFEFSIDEIKFLTSQVEDLFPSPIILGRWKQFIGDLST